MLTNSHVIDLATQITVYLRDSVQLQGQVVANDLARDLAVISVCCDGEIEAVSLEPEVRVGETVAALGYPLGVDTLRVSQGVISGKQFDAETDRFELQTDAALNPGNSGGPLVLPNGTVAGITTYKVVQTDSGIAVEGVNFAVASETLIEIVPELILGRVTAAPTPTPHPNVTGGFYTHPTYRWIISVPDGWIIDDSDQYVTVIYNRRIETFVLVNVVGLGGWTGHIFEFIEEFTFQPSPAWEHYSLLGEGKISRNGKNSTPVFGGYEFQYIFSFNNSAYRGFTHWFIWGTGLNETFMILPAYVWDEESFEPYRTELRNMFNSFRPSDIH